jgi:hypothetical protein
MVKSGLLSFLLVAAAFAQPSAPVLQSLVPNSVLEGSGPVTVILTGSGFNESSIVTVSGSPNITPERLDANTLRVVLPATFFTTSRTIGVTVFNRDTNLGSQQFPFYVYSPFPPVVTSMIPDGGVRGTMTSIRLEGRNLTGATISFSGSGISVVPQSSPADLAVLVAADAPLGSQVMTVSTPFGSTTLCGERPCTFSVIDSGIWSEVSVSGFESGFEPGVVIKLLDGNVLVAGGAVRRPGVGPAIPVGSAWIFNPLTMEWTQTGSMLETKNQSAVASLLPDGRVLIARSDATAEIYDPATGTWSPMGSMTRGAGGRAVLLPTGKVLVGHNSINDFSADVFDPVTGRFAPSGISFAFPSGPASMELLADGRVLIVGAGQENRIYDPVKGTLSIVPSISINGSGQWIRLLPDGRVLVRGGTIIGPSAATSNASIYDVRTNTVVPVPSAPSLSGSDVLLPSGLLLINRTATGRTQGGGFITISTPILYEPLTDQILPQLPNTPTIGVSILLDDGRAFGIGYTADSQITGTFARMYAPVPSANPAPVIGSVISNNLILDIRGAHFLPNSFVRLGQAKLVTLYMGSEHLVAFVPSALASSLNAGITVSNPGPGGGQSESVRVGFTATVPLPIAEIESGTTRSGYIVVTPDSGTGAPVATLTYGLVRDAIVQSQAAILPAPQTTETSLIVDTVRAIGRNVGIAIANTNSSTATISLTLRNQDGTAAAPVVTFPLSPQSQVARFVTELFSSELMGSAFRGSLTIQSSLPVSIVGLRFSGGEFSSIPTPFNALSRAGSTIFFPQFAIGGGWATTLGLLNNSSEPMSGRVSIFDKDGRSMTVTFNGVTASTFDYAIPARGSVTLAPRDSNGQSPF